MPHLLHHFACFQVTFEQTVAQVARLDRFSSAVINVSLSDTSASNTEHRLHHCPGTICAVWRVDSFAKTIAKLFPASEDWHFWDDRPQSSGGKQEGCAKKTQDLSAADTLFLLSCFVLVSVGDALSKFCQLSLENCW